MTRPTTNDIRDRVRSDVLQNTNKPRFCFMGYAPPLCVGDEYRAPPQAKEARISSKPPVVVPFPKRGSVFSKPQPLCIGDLYPGSLVTRKVRDSAKEPFKSGGHLDFLGRLEYMADPEVYAVRKNTADKAKKAAAFVPLGVCKGRLFHEHIEYLPASGGTGKTEPQAKDQDTRAPFKLAAGSASIPALPYKDIPSVLSTPNELKETTKPTQPFKPAGGRLTYTYPEYIPSPPSSTSSKERLDKTGMKLGSPDVISSPIPSVMLMNLKLGRM